MKGACARCRVEWLRVVRNLWVGVKRTYQHDGNLMGRKCSLVPTAAIGRAAQVTFGLYLSVFFLLCCCRLNTPGE